MRFYVSPDRREAVWCHPLEAATRCPGWIDCTDMNDDEFSIWMAGWNEE